MPNTDTSLEQRATDEAVLADSSVANCSKVLHERVVDRALQ